VQEPLSHTQLLLVIMWPTRRGVGTKQVDIIISHHTKFHTTKVTKYYHLFLTLCNTQTVSKTHPASYLRGTRGSFPGAKVTRGPYHLLQRLRMRGVTSMPPHIFIPENLNKKYFLPLCLPRLPPPPPQDMHLSLMGRFFTVF